MQYMELPIESIELDKNNPRIQQYLEIYGDNITSEAIALALSGASGNSSSTYQTLKESIRVNGGIINPIIVNKFPDNRYVVIEGNTRLQIYKEFAIMNPDGPWKKIISIVYDNMPENEIHAIRLQAHMVGPREWDPFSKAKYLNQLDKECKLPKAVIVSMCGGKQSEIDKLINAYTDMKINYFPLAEKAGMEPDPRDFSKFVELQNGAIRQALLVHGQTKDSFAKWVIQGNIDTAQNVRRLPAILANKVAFDEFLKTNISEAVKYLNASEKGAKGLADASMDDLVTELITRCDRIDWNYVKKLRDDPRFSCNKDNIKALAEALAELLGEIDV